MGSPPVGRRGLAVRVLTMTMLAFAPSAGARGYSASELRLVGMINQVRAAHVLPPLRADATLERAARAHTRRCSARALLPRRLRRPDPRAWRPLSRRSARTSPGAQAALGARSLDRAALAREPGAPREPAAAGLTRIVGVGDAARHLRRPPPHADDHRRTSPALALPARSSRSRSSASFSRRSSSRSPRVDPPDQLAHERRQLDRVERLRHVVDPAEVEAPGAVAQPRRGRSGRRSGSRSSARRRAAAPPPASRRARASSRRAGSTSGLLVARLLDPGRAVARLEHLHPLRLEIHPAEEPDRRLVVDYQHPRHRPSCSARRSYPSRPDSLPLTDTAARRAARRRSSSPRPRGSDRDPAAHREHEPLGDEEPEAGAAGARSPRRRRGRTSRRSAPAPPTGCRCPRRRRSARRCRPCGAPTTRHRPAPGRVLDGVLDRLLTICRSFSRSASAAAAPAAGRRTNSWPFEPTASASPPRRPR